MMILLGSAARINQEAKKIDQNLYGRYQKFYLSQRKNEDDVKNELRNSKKEGKEVKNEIKSVKNEIGTLIESMKSESVGISPCDAFLITKKFFVAMVGIMVTYYATLVQFVYQGCDCKNEIRNSTV